MTKTFRNKNKNILNPNNMIDKKMNLQDLQEAQKKYENEISLLPASKKLEKIKKVREMVEETLANCRPSTHQELIKYHKQELARLEKLPKLKK